MPQTTLYAPDITCDHCIATIRKAVDGIEGAHFVHGDPDARSFIVDVERGAVLDTLAEVLAGEGYPLGDAEAARAASASGAPGAMGIPMAGERPGFTPSLTIEKSAEGAAITYTCPCGSTTERYTFDRSQPEQAVGSCCDHHLLVQADAGARLRERLGEGYQVTVQPVEMPWGQPMEAAFGTRK
jgi:copper chaperone CopZ